MPYTPEAAEVPALVIIRPTYNAAGAITAVPTQFNYIARVKNDADNTDVLIKETKPISNPTVDMYDNVKTATVGAVPLTYRQILQYLKKVGDQERALLPP